ncbi:MAG: hypothetical protein ABJN40_06020 [Sneathiella sp.]
MDLGPVNYSDALFIAKNMREWDRKEIYASRWNDDPHELAAECLSIGGFSWIAYDPEPIAIIGAVPLRPGVWNVFMFATDKFSKIAISLTKFAKNVMMPSLIAAGAHRGECQSMAGHDDAHNWLEFLGAKRESTSEGYGRGREDFHTYIWMAN